MLLEFMVATALAGAEPYCGRDLGRAVPAQLRRVVDGDTIDLRLNLGHGVLFDRRIRLIGVDTPEVRGPQRPQGLRVKLLVERWLDSAGELELVDAGKGKFDRLGIVRAKQGSLNQWLLDQGHAKPYCGGPKNAK